MSDRLRRRFLLGLAGVVLAAAGYQPGRAAAQEGERPAIERCRDFCGRVYSESSDDFKECAVACDEADACHRNCKEKLGEDRPKVQKCLRNCMRRGAEPPDEPEESQEHPIEL